MHVSEGLQQLPHKFNTRTSLKNGRFTHTISAFEFNSLIETFNGTVGSVLQKQERATIRTFGFAVAFQDVRMLA